MVCYVLSRDLLFSSQAMATARAAGFAAHVLPAASLPNRSVGESSNFSAPVVIIDLTLPGLELQSLVEDFRAHDATIIAVGPHVQELRLEAARQSGCHHVLSRGEAVRDLGKILAQLAQFTPPSP